MTGRFAEAIAKAAADTPMASHSTPTVSGRVLLADGDGLAYYCAGNDNTDPGTARQNLKDKLDAARRACGAETVRILVTHASSHKGWRYAIARVKPYQGQRKADRKPKNWRYLRDVLSADSFAGYQIEATAEAEADDLFGFHARIGEATDKVALLTQDKDMRMCPGWHLDWTTHQLFRLRRDQWAAEFNDKVYGRKWFWLQMLHGDTADYIPGLPKYKTADGKLKQCGEKTALELLKGIDGDAGAFERVRSLYAGYYEDAWPEQMLEQACLLWMRTDASAAVLNVAAPDNPMQYLRLLPEWERARTAILARVAEAMMYAQEAQGQ